MCSSRIARPFVRFGACLALPRSTDAPPFLSRYPFELLRVRKLPLLTPPVQMAIVATLYAVTTLLFARGFRLTGTMLGTTPEVWILFVPITEEIL